MLRTMVFGHLPSNVLLAAVPFAPSLPRAIMLLPARACLSQMDVPTRQAYVMALVPAEERTAAAAVTNTAHYVTRPAGPAMAGLLQPIDLALQFLIAGAPRPATTSPYGAPFGVFDCQRPEVVIIIAAAVGGSLHRLAPGAVTSRKGHSDGRAGATHP